MTSATPMSAFCQWLLAEPTNTPACAIVIHGEPEVANGSIIDGIAQYLNEYDGEADGFWLSATEELIHMAASDPGNRRLLGLEDLDDPDEATSMAQIRKTIHALGHKGHLVFRCPEEPATDLTPGLAFHAGVGNHLSLTTPCHISIDPSLVSPSAIPHIIGDVFLEWFLGPESPCLDPTGT